MKTGKRVKPVFISYATEDKFMVVDPVVWHLDKLRVPYYYDQKDILWGYSLHRTLSAGLGRSKFFVAFVSEYYARKRYTNAEMDVAFNRHIVNREGFLLPILVGSDQQRKRILRKYTFLKDLHYLVWEDNAAEIAVNLAVRLKHNGQNL